MDIKGFTISINIVADGKQFTTYQKVDGDVTSDLLKQMYKESTAKIGNQIDTKFKSKEVVDDYGR
jgi:pyoverdine/dityrosine biosynthesis protein Dit1